MSVMTSQVLKSVDSSRIKTFVFLRNKALFFLQVSKIINYT